jgi:hypothetical protein
MFFKNIENFNENHKIIIIPYEIGQDQVSSGESREPAEM